MIDPRLVEVARAFEGLYDRLAALTGGEPCVPMVFETEETTRADREFVETDHPRAEDGKFGSGGGSGITKSSEKTTAGGGSERSEGKEASGSKEPPTPKKSAREPLNETIEIDGKRFLKGGAALPAHIEKLKLPPAWKNVSVASDPGAALQAVGFDAKGRRQAVYSAEFSATNAAAKFERVDSLMKQFDGIAKQNDLAVKNGDKKTRENAACLDLIMKMGLRPGSETDTGADKQAYGATTLLGEHVVQEDDRTFLRFTGKKGVALNLEVTDPSLAKNLTDRAAKAGTDGKLFTGVSDKSLLDHSHSLGDGSFKSKDFRTHLGTSTAGKLIAAMPVPTDAKSYQKSVKEVATKVSKLLGNTPTICLQSYISPAVFSAWQMNGGG